jgi:hypothetical protein
MTKGILCAMTLLLNSVAFADDAADRAKLTGQWRLQTENPSDPNSIWTIDQKADSIRIVAMKGDQKLSEIECNTSGRECETKDSGRQVKVSLYFNGPKLIELETRGSEVIKRRFGVAGSGDVMELEIIPIVPSGKTETLRFKHVDVAVAGK